MNYKKIILYIVFIITCLNSCIEEYIPNIKSSDSKKYVVSGILTDQEGYQEINISLSSSVSNPKLTPVKNCQVEFIDSNKNSISLNEYKSGVYRAWISQNFLNIGMAYQLKITTPDGTNIISDPEKLMECPNIDSVYFNREDIPTNNPEVNIKGIQFYLDLNATNVNSKYFKFDIEETSEYHAMYPLEFWYDGVEHQLSARDYSYNICWKTENIKDLFILTTSDLEVNKYKMFPLHFVDNKTSRLAYGYSILIKQYSISEKNFIFWDQLRSNNLSDISLYETQPLQVHGNLYNLTNPNQTVLGYFQVSAVKTKRIFVNKVENLELDYSTSCSPSLIREPFRDYTPADYPVYFWHGPATGFWELTEECIFCTKLGGTLTKPYFWPNYEL